MGQKVAVVSISEIEDDWEIVLPVLLYAYM